MGADIVLVAPESEWSEDLLRQYLEYRQTKRAEMFPEKDWPDIKETTEYRVAVECLDQTLLVMEQLLRDVWPAIDTDELYKLLGHANDQRVIYGGEIRELIDLFRDAKHELVRNGKSTKWVKMNVDTKPIVVCEFALERDYGVRLSE